MNSFFFVSFEFTPDINFSSCGNLLTSLNNIFYALYLCVQKEERPVQMMHQEDKFNYAYVKEVQAKVLEMPYKGKELSLVILLPDKGVDLSQVRQESP